MYPDQIAGRDFFLKYLGNKSIIAVTAATTTAVKISMADWKTACTQVPLKCPISGDKLEHARAISCSIVNHDKHVMSMLSMSLS